MDDEWASKAGPKFDKEQAGAGNWKNRATMCTRTSLPEPPDSFGGFGVIIVGRFEVLPRLETASRVVSLGVHLGVRRWMLTSILSININLSAG